jgi:putative tricarboxylic transport membrane protein
MPVAHENPGTPGEPVSSGVRTRRRSLHSDLAIALCIVGFCAVVYAITLTFPIVSAALAIGMGPEVFPRLLLGVLVVLAGLLALLARGKADEIREPVTTMVYWTGLAMIAFMGVLWLAGMVAAMFIGFVGIGRLWGERRWTILVISALLLSALIYTVFVKGFGIPLPRGVIGDWLD